MRHPEYNGLWVEDDELMMYFRNFPSLFSSLINMPFSQGLLSEAISQKTTVMVISRSPDSSFDDKESSKERRMHVYPNPDSYLKTCFSPFYYKTPHSSFQGGTGWHSLYDICLAKQ